MVLGLKERDKMDTYQPIYDAASQCLRRFDPSALYREIASKFDISFGLARIQEDIGILIEKMGRPSVLYRPKATKIGDAWWVYYGGSQPPEGICGRGNTPEEAMDDFDRKWIGVK